jgi:xanthosine utilization system XapX-like protein
MTFSFIAGDAPSEIVLTAILGIFGGENIGKAVREIKGDDNAKKKN